MKLEHQEHISNINKRYECPLCQSDVQNSSHVGNTFAQCNECLLIYNRIFPIVHYEEYWTNYTFDSEIKKYDFARIPYYKYFWNYITKITGKSKGDLLEVGCGHGLILKSATLNQWRAQGIDISTSICDYARSNSGCEVFQGDVNSIDLSQKKFDIILISDVFRSLPEPRKTLQICVEHLKSDGAIVIRDLNIDHSRSRQRFSVEQQAHDLQCLSRQTARRFFGYAGISDVRYYPSPMPFSKFLHLNSYLYMPIFRLLNASMQFAFKMSLGKWLSVTPEMLIIGRKTNG